MDIKTYYREILNGYDTKSFVTLFLSDPSISGSKNNWKYEISDNSANKVTLAGTLPESKDCHLILKFTRDGNTVEVDLTVPSLHSHVTAAYLNDILFGSFYSLHQDDMKREFIEAIKTAAELAIDNKLKNKTNFSGSILTYKTTVLENFKDRLEATWE